MLKKKKDKSNLQKECVDDNRAYHPQQKKFLKDEIRKRKGKNKEWL